MSKKMLFSKVIMLFMVVAMTCQMFSATVFAIDAAEKGQITINGAEEEVNVYAYRLMDVHFDYENQQPENPVYTWVTEAADWVYLNYPEFIDVDNLNAVKEEFSEAADAKVAEFYDKLAAAIKSEALTLSVKTVKSEGETVVVGDLEMGNYFLLMEDGTKIYRPLSANIVPVWSDNGWQMTAPVVSAKASKPTITKTMEGGLEEDNINIGDTIIYEVIATIPTYPENAVSKRYTISDRMDDSLTFVEGSLKIYGQVNGEEDVLLETGYVNTEAQTYAISGKTVFMLEFDYDAICGYETIKLTYKAVLNEKSRVGNLGNFNIASVSYSHNPYEEYGWDFDDSQTVVYTYGIEVEKIDEDTKEPLSGAEFVLLKDGKELAFAGMEGFYYLSDEASGGSKTVKVAEEGFLVLYGLDEGTYYLKETKAPDGYVKLQNPMEIVIEDNDLNGYIEVDNEELETGYLPVTISNNKGFTLPVTGGMGTTVFNIVGIVLIAAGALLIVCYRKRKAK